MECDVLVVGAGPAGAVAALYCSKNGLDTVLVEKNREVGLHAGRRLDSSPDTNFELSKIVKELKLRTEHYVRTSKWFHLPSARFFVLNSEAGEYYFKRGYDENSFERSTVASALDHGCKLLLNTEVKQVRHDDGKDCKVLLQLRRGGETEKAQIIKPKVIIAADGCHSSLHKHLNLKKRVYRVGRIFGVTGEGFSDDGSSEVYFDANAIPGGYFYILTAKSGLSTAAIVMPGEIDPKKRFYAFVSKNMHDRIRHVENEFSGGAVIFKLNRLRRGNVLFVGDAAGLIDPLLGYGMAPAIISSYLAARCCVDAVRGDDLNIGSLKRYEKEAEVRFKRVLAYLLRGIFEALDDEYLELVFDMMEEMQRRGVDFDKLSNFDMKSMFKAFSAFCEKLPKSAQLLRIVLKLRMSYGRGM
ncbi:MAG TPA: NAD(P)/FAD-dependent oxidoreductase [Methanomicrobia archaeon]|nr:NAD(P)/FAD-dependent oxidoreductase [Methanomicrobia archaeon]HEX58897.1 NAD(P)/FAD-dependent oxidoreductase [Methanomicrobia archaeon]